ncbi:MAG: GIY-YIG nuclease family protein, partial [Candidatus Spechtbacterales bacterium]
TNLTFLSEARSLKMSGPLSIMFFTYILKSTKADKTYVGFCNNIEVRLQKHNSGQVESTKCFMPWEIIYLEKYQTGREAKYREKYWKSGAGRRKLKQYFEKNEPLA